MPRALPEALLEGLAWDAMGRRYETLSGLFDYSARVAAAVGAMMCVLMGVRDANALARACDLGVAMQLTNIARDVGEDARARRIYLPLDWLDEAGLAPRGDLRRPAPGRAHPRHGAAPAPAGGPTLFPRGGGDSGPAARRAGPASLRRATSMPGIGGAIARNGFDTVSYRARTYKAQKMGWLGLSLARAAVSTVMPGSAVLYARPLRGDALPRGRGGADSAGGAGADGSAPWASSPTSRRATVRCGHWNGRAPELYPVDGLDTVRHLSSPPASPQASTGALFEPGDWYKRLTKPSGRRRTGCSRWRGPRFTSASPRRPRAWRRSTAASSDGVLRAADRAQHAVDAGVLRPEAMRRGNGGARRALDRGGGDDLLSFWRSTGSRGCCSCPTSSG